MQDEFDRDRDRDYHRARAEAERTAMRNAGSDVARHIHADLAQQHAERAGILDSSSHQIDQQIVPARLSR